MQQLRSKKKNNIEKEKGGEKKKERKKRKTQRGVPAEVLPLELSKSSLVAQSELQQMLMLLFALNALQVEKAQGHLPLVVDD